jgi:hypothetical protein
MLPIEVKGPHIHVCAQCDRLVPLLKRSLLDELEQQLAQALSHIVGVDAHATDMAVSLAVR